MQKAKAGHPRRQKILAAARALFARQGYAHTSMDELAEEAGITKPTLYAAFDDKADVFYRALELELADWSRLAIARADPARPATELLAEHGLFGLEQLKARPLVRALLAGECHELAWASPGFAALRAQLNAATEHILKLGVSQGSFRAGLDLSAIAELLLDLMTAGVLFHGLDAPGREEELLRRFGAGYDAILRGITRRNER